MRHFILTSTITALALTALVGCGCPSIGYIDGLEIGLPDIELDDARQWSLAVTLDSGLACTIDAATLDDPAGSDCADVLHWDQYNGNDHVTVRLDTPEWLHLRLVVDDALWFDDTVEPQYETSTPNGPFCPGPTDAVVVLRAP